MAWLSIALSWMPAGVAAQSADTQPVRSDGPIQLRNAILKPVGVTTISAEVTGILEALPIDLGTSIQPGDELARIRQDEILNRLQRAKLELALATEKCVSTVDLQVTQKSAAVAENEYRRAQEANRDVPNTYPPNEIDRLQLVFERSELEVQRAEEQRAQLKLQQQLAQNQVQEMELTLRNHRVLAPSPGVVVAVERAIGEWVEPGTAIATIVNIQKLRIEGFVTATEAMGIDIGDPARVEVRAQPDREPITGRVVFVGLDVNAVSDLVRVYVDIDNPSQSLRPGLKTLVYLPRPEP